MSTLLQLAVSGILNGAVLALMAVGLALVFGIMRVINLSHGAFFALGSFLTYTISVSMGKSPLLAPAVAAPAAFALGVIFDRLCLAPVRQHHATVALVTLAASIVCEQVFQLLWGPQYLSMPKPLPAVEAGGVVVDLQQLVAGLAAVALTAALFLGLRTGWGTAVRMVAQDPEGAQLLGINVEAIQTLIFGLASALAAVAGSLTAPLHTIHPTMGRAPMILSLAVVVVGGLGNVQAALVAGLVVGTCAQAVSFYLAAQWSYVFALAAIVLVLLTRPHGLLGKTIKRD
ncbi:branched-chain amino acid ABC transporter permease [Desulfovirgula thermocuniculi]|uniref:branched-chain amino acid ABC transporter permease n=1 Tax=Desulfovirgula thermocuniculi TaxID=348842 RepID=UPI0003F56BC5|nr:branched-chain amino acid ABC transporter permease [Desulfovirgula thermocuniculi]